MNDLRILQEKDNESLQAEIKDLKETLVMKGLCLVTVRLSGVDLRLAWHVTRHSSVIWLLAHFS